MSDRQLHRILFLSVPESLRGQIENVSKNSADFSIDPDIPLPVEIPNGEENLNLEELSWEMIISGMLRVIADGEMNADENISPYRINYYRAFVLAVRPAILSEFTEAAILKAHNNDFDLALEIFDSLQGLFPHSAAVALNRALVMEERASMMERRNTQDAEAAYQAAEAAYTKAIDLNPSFPDTRFNAGFFYLGRKNFSYARECFLQYIELTEDSNDPGYESKIKQAKSAIAEIDTNGLEDESLSNAYTQIQGGNEEAGMHSIRDYIERYPSVWNGWFILGWALRRLSRWQDAAAAFGKVIELGGGNSDTRNERAICLMELGDLQEARRELESALCDDPENVKIISNMGVLALKSGNREEAAAFFRTVLELDPQDPIAKKLGVSN